MGYLIAIILAAIAFYFLSKYVLINLSPLLLNLVKVLFVVGIVAVAYFNYSSIQGKIELEAEIAHRDKVVQNRLNEIKDAQIAFKKEKGFYARDFRQLTHFLTNDSIVIVRAEGEVPDSLIGQEALALEMGIIIRDTSLVPVREKIFVDADFDEIVKNMPFVPFNDNVEFTINAGEVEKGKVKVKVFEVKVPKRTIYNGLDVENQGLKLDKDMALGSMTEPTTNGNWD